MSISQRLVASFTTVLLLFAVAVGVTCLAISAVRHDADLLVHLDGPRSRQATEITGQVDASLSALQAWMLSADPRAKGARVAAWSAIAASAAEMDRLMAREAGAAMSASWQQAREHLSSLREAEEEVERIANSPQEQPATGLLNEEAMPLFNVMGAQLTAMMDEEARLEATPERKELLRQMAEFRGPLGLAGANLRAFLSTGDKAVKATFEAMSARTRAGHDYLASHGALLTPTQAAAMEKVETAWRTFLPMPERLIAIRESDGWNVRDTLMRTKVLPRVAQMQEALRGKAGTDGGVVGLAAQQLSQRSDGLNARLDGLQLLSIVLLVVGLAIAAVLGTYTTRAIVRPLRAMTEAMRRLAAEDFSVEVPAVGRKDEMGSMATAVQAFQRDGREKRRLEAEARRDGTEREARQAEVTRHTQDFGTAISDVLETLRVSSGAMREAATGMAGAVDRTRGQSALTVTGAEASARNLASVAAAAEQLTTSIDEIGRQVGHAATTARQTVARAEETGRTVRSLSDAANQINDIVLLINSIATKTNLLALNATIEAARAGDAGRGFAVVAAEVKQLAAQTAGATERISTQIAAIQSVTGQATEAMRGVSESVLRMDEVASSIAAAVEQQGAATREISTSVQAISAQNDDATSAMREVSSIAEAAGGSSRAVLTAADDVAKVSGTLSRNVGQFLTLVRSEERSGVLSPA